mmetsp:Transcript_93114/g.146328  ORF Transcript_93114/g.146328 Transcript_93114/m.146328 type:complete len:1167 (-) Transcript_93114:84-3584(-)
MCSEDDLRAAFQNELVQISQFRSLKADACDMRRKLTADLAAASAPVAPNANTAAEMSGDESARTAAATSELLEKRKKIRAEQEETLRRLRAEILIEKQAPPFFDASSRVPSPLSTRSPSPGNRELSEDPSADETVALPKSTAKGKGRPSGKGGPPGPPKRESKGNGKGRAPPAPHHGKGGKDRSAGERTPGGRRLVSLHWRSSLEPEEAEVSVVEDSYLAGMVDMLPKQRQAAKQCSDNLSFFEKAVGVTDAFCLNCSVDDDRTPVRSPSPQPREMEPLTPTFTPTHFDTTPTAVITPAKNAAAQASPSTTTRRRRRNTIFSGDCPVREMPSSKLEEFFQLRNAAVDVGSRASTGTVRTLIRDAKHLQIIDILVKKEAIMSKQAHHTRQQSEEAAVDALILALRRCDYTRCPPQALEDIHKVVSGHMKEQSHQNVCQFVELRGEDALQQLDHPQLHRWLYGVLQIPAIDARLECMVMEANAEESFKHCYSNLMTLGSGLVALTKIIEPLRYFFASMKMLGNMLNRDSSNASASISGHGVKMVSIERMMQLKSPVHHEVTLFHLVILIVPPEMLDKLIDPSVIDDLNKAKLARSFTVHQVCTQFLDGFRQIKQLVETGKYQQLAEPGKYKDVEIPVDSRPCGPEASADGVPEGDVFFKNMREFVATRQEQADQIALLCTHVYEKYRSFGAYIDDLKYVYPPPNDDSQTSQAGEERKDLFQLFHWLLISVRQTKDEIVQLKLNVELEKIGYDATPAAPVNGQSACKMDYTKDEVRPQLSARSIREPENSSLNSASRLLNSSPTEMTSASMHPEAVQESKSEAPLDCQNKEDVTRENLGALAPKGCASPRAIQQNQEEVVSPVLPAKQAMNPGTSNSTRVLRQPASPPPGAHAIAPAPTSQRIPSPPPCRSPGSPTSVRRLSSGSGTQHASCMQAKVITSLPPSRPVVKSANCLSNKGPLLLPGLQIGGTPTLQSARLSGQGRESTSSSESNGSDSGKASKIVSPRTSPANTTRKCRKSVTNLANKAERQGISRVLGESAATMTSSRASSMSPSPSRSPSPNKEAGSEKHSSLPVGFAAEIREGARMLQGRFFKGQHALQLPLGEDELGDDSLAWRTCRSPDARTPGTSRYALSPVWEHTSEASPCMTPAWRSRAYDHLSPVPSLQHLQ